MLTFHYVVGAYAQCKDEASEYTGFECHGNADTPELKSVLSGLLKTCKNSYGRP